MTLSSRMDAPGKLLASALPASVLSASDTVPEASCAVRLLMAEDCVDDSVLNLAALRRHGFSITHDLVDTPEAFRRCLAENDYDLVLSDHNLQSWSGTDALEMVHQSGKEIPVIIVTGHLGDEQAVEYLKQGAADYVVKEHLGRLPLAVKRALQEKARREENLRLQAAIQSAKEDWERTFDAIPDSMMLLDRESRIVRANRASASLFKMELSAMIGLQCWDVAYSRVTSPVDCPLRRVFASGKEESAEIVDAETGRIFGVTVIPLHNQAGQIDSVIHVMTDITVRKRAENAKTILLKEVHHRVKNNLAVICALLHLQSRKDKDEQVHLSLRACEQRIRSIALLHEHIYRSESFDRIDFATYARQLGHQLCSALGVSETNIHFELDLSSIEVSSAVAGACGLVLNELVTNALKHAFPDGRQGTIRVTFHATTPGLACLAVIDDGVGIPEGSGPDGAESSLGLRIVKVLAQQLDGSVRVVRDHGTSIELTFPYGAAGAGEAGAEI